MRNNKTNKPVGVWMDHSQAHFIDFAKGFPVVETVYSAQEEQVRFKGESGSATKLGNYRSGNNENHRHNRDQQLMQEYYKILSDRLKNYDNILLFGSTKAKEELYNYLKLNKQFEAKSITVKPADHLTENQMIAEVKKFFDLEKS